MTTTQLPPIDSAKTRRLLLVVPWLTVGGADRVHLDLARMLRARDWRVDVLLTELHGNEWLAEGRLAADSVIEAARLAPPDNFDDLASRLLDGDRYTHVLISNSVRGYQALPHLTQRHPDTVFVDLLHGQGGHNDAGGSPEYSRPFAHLLDHRITVTEYLRRRMIADGEPPAHVTTIHNGVTIPSSDTREKQVGHSPSICFLGRLSAEKRPWVMLQLARLLPEVQVVVAGDGPLRRELRRQAGSNVTMRRHIADVVTFLAKVDLLVLPSEMEGLPLAILEAMSVGVPPVAAAVGGIPEAITADTGVLMPDEANVEAYAATVRDLLQDSERRECLGRAASARVGQLFSLEVFADRYDSLLSGLAPAQAPERP